MILFLRGVCPGGWLGKARLISSLRLTPRSMSNGRRQEALTTKRSFPLNNGDLDQFLWKNEPHTMIETARVPPTSWYSHLPNPVPNAPTFLNFLLTPTLFFLP